MKKLLSMLCFSIIASRIFADNNTILVGTTGDYPPLTYKNEQGFTGKDIQIINDFATANNLTLQFVPTTWPTLSNDLSQGKFNIAVGGISANPERTKLFYLSDAIESSAKAPMIRCSDVGKFTSLAAIDNESVIVAENRGGTNQDFALKNIKHATVILYPQNFTALASLTQNPPKADVMFTDDVEIGYRHSINSKLCLANIPEKFASSSKVFIFAKTTQGKLLQEKFNLWWAANKSKYNQN